MSTVIDTPATPPRVSVGSEHSQDAYRDVLLAVQRALAANWDDDQPRIAVVERNGISTVYVSTIQTVGSGARLDIRGAVRAALAPYSPLAPYTSVIFLRRGAP
ncbi:hypothetical protein ABIA35_009521 [Catenulispora sp. MAP12-49]|uniref:hypothetical protein n=1 Tax=Catenulispora sp. MAP12-49 TaxID=3156302 RepID=UPI0035116F79